MEINNELRVNLETIRSFVKLGLEGPCGEKNGVIVRESCINVYNHIVRCELGLIPNCRKPGHYYMSQRFHENWKIERRYDGIREHIVPMRILVKGLQDISDLDLIYANLKQCLKIVWVTHEEDRCLARLGLRANMPSNGRSRYEEAAIALHPELVRTAVRAPR